MNARPVSLLIVDDDPVFAHFVRQLVLSLGEDFPCSPQWVDTPDAALAEVGRNVYEVVLLDYHLPTADGLEVLARIRALPGETQPAVIMLTGSGSELVAVEAMKRGAKDYLCKAGLDEAQLMRALRSAMKQKQLEEQVAHYNAQMKLDLAMARQLQQSLLPVRYPSFPASATPADSALRFCHRFIPATELAGDFFSVVALSDTQAGVFICDVMGHGVRSALITAMMHALVETEAQRAASPGDFLATMNSRIARLVRPAEGPMFATAFYLVADVERAVLRYANAGHPRPLHLQRGGAAGLLAGQPGSALGLFADSAYSTNERPLAVGDRLLLFTDGLFEAAAAGGLDECYGRPRLLEAANACVRMTGDSLCDTLIRGVRDFAGGAEFGDDVCLLCVEVARLAVAAK